MVVAAGVDVAYILAAAVASVVNTLTDNEKKIGGGLIYCYTFDDANATASSHTITITLSH
jgi:hypothetical protein